MSQYLCFYLKPKDWDHSLCFATYSRSSDLYGAFTEVLSVPYGDKLKIGYADIAKVQHYVCEEIEQISRALAIDYKIIQGQVNWAGEGKLEAFEGMRDNIQTHERILKEQQQLLEEIKFLERTASDIELGVTDFTEMQITIE
jgi:hypothetical protein